MPISAAIDTTRRSAWSGSRCEINSASHPSTISRIRESGMNRTLPRVPHRSNPTVIDRVLTTKPSLYSLNTSTPFFRYGCANRSATRPILLSKNACNCAESSHRVSCTSTSSAASASCRSTDEVFPDFWPAEDTFPDVRPAKDALADFPPDTTASAGFASKVLSISPNNTSA